MVPVLTSCDNDDFNTDQYTGGIHLNVFGPSPVARGGELRFLGSGMDKITKVSIPGCDDIVNIDVVSSEEIRVTVPQTAQPGFVTLHYADGTIVTKTELTYSEPISIETIAPNPVKPGKVLTFTGEYLNLIKEVCFAFETDSVNVYADYFISHERNELSLIVPEEAVSGQIILSDAKAMPNTIKSDDIIGIILPSVEKPIDLTSARPGDRVVINGKDLDLVRKMEMPSGDDLSFEYNSETGAIAFVLPDNSTDGAVVMIPASGVKVAAANIGMAVPSQLTATPSADIRAGQEIVIKGVNMDQTVSVSFPNVEEPIEPSSISAGEIRVVFPEMAQSGDAVLNLKSGKNVTVALSTAKPEVMGFNPDVVAAASQFTMTGKNLDLVTLVTFAGGASVEVSNPAADAISMIAPATAETGELTVTMANGETVKTQVLTISKPECAFISSVENEELKAGELMTAVIENGDKLTKVTVNGTDVQFIVNGGKLYISLPSSCGKNTVVKLISSNGEISYTYDVTPATHVEKVVFNQMRDLGNWAGEGDGGAFRINKSDLEGIPAGAKLVFHINPYGTPQIQVNDANWGQMAMLEPSADDKTAVFELTAEYLNRILTTEDGWSETAMVIQGQGTIVNKVTVEYEQSLETAIWTGSWESGNWGGNQDLAWGGYDWSTVKPGNTLRIYVTPMVADPASDWWCVALRHGDGWNMLPAPVPDQWGQPVSGVVETTLTAEVIADLVANGGLVITGADYTLTRVTIE